MIDDIGIDQHYIGDPDANQLLCQRRAGAAYSNDCHRKAADSVVAQIGQCPDLTVIQPQVRAGLLVYRVQRLDAASSEGLKPVKPNRLCRVSCLEYHSCHSLW